MNKIVLAKKQILKIIFDNKDKFTDITPDIINLISTPAQNCMGCYNKIIYTKLDIILSKNGDEILKRIGQMLNGTIEIYPY